MSHEFNPYCQFLGLDQADTEPNHYVLLGLPQYEADLETIAAGANRAISRVRGQRPGQRVAEWSALLDQLKAAKDCLTQPNKKEKYDQQLHEANSRTSDPSEASEDRSQTVNPAYPPGWGGNPGAGESAAGPSEAVSVDDVPTTPATPIPLDDFAVVSSLLGLPSAADPMSPVKPVPDVPAGQTVSMPSSPPVPMPGVGQEPAARDHVPVSDSSSIPFAIPVAVPVSLGPGKGPAVGGPPGMPTQPGVATPVFEDVPPAIGFSPDLTELPRPNWVTSPRTITSTRNPWLGGMKLWGGMTLSVLLLGVSILTFVLTQLTDESEGIAGKINEIYNGRVASPSTGGRKPLEKVHVPKRDKKIINRRPKPLETHRPPATIDRPGPNPGLVAEPPEVDLRPPINVESSDPPMPPPTRAELVKLSVALKSSRAALTERDLEAADRELEEAEQLARLPEHVALVKRLRLLHDYVKEFWNAVAEGMKRLDTEGELKINNTIASVVEATEDRIVVRVNGQNLRYNRMQLPAGLALAIADNWFDASRPVNRVFRGAFLAVEPNYEADEARAVWEKAAKAGVDQVQDLMPVLDDEYDLVE